MSEEIEITPDLSPLDLGDGRAVLFDEPTGGFYRVQMANGEVQAFPARGDATRENAVSDIAAAEADLAPCRESLLLRAKQRRREVEEGGITLPNGAQFATDRESQAMLDGALSLASLSGLGSQFTTQWKCADGVFRTVTHAELMAAALAVGTHVQTCFAREAALAQAINAAEDAAQLLALVPEVEAFELE